MLWESHEEMSSNTSEVSGGWGETMPCGGIANRDACWEGRVGGGDTMFRSEITESYKE